MIDNRLLENHLNDFRNGVAKKFFGKEPLEPTKNPEFQDDSREQIIKKSPFFVILDTILIIFAYLIRCTLFGLALGSIFSYSWGVVPLFAVGFLTNYTFTVITNLFKK